MARRQGRANILTLLLVAVLAVLGVGAYTFVPEGNGTDITYSLKIELIVPLPGFVKRRAEVRILHTLKELKIRAES